MRPMLSKMLFLYRMIEPDVLGRRVKTLSPGGVETWTSSEVKPDKSAIRQKRDKTIAFRTKRSGRPSRNNQLLAETSAATRSLLLLNHF